MGTAKYHQMSHGREEGSNITHRRNKYFLILGSNARGFFRTNKIKTLSLAHMVWQTAHMFGEQPNYLANSIQNLAHKSAMMLWQIFSLCGNVGEIEQQFFCQINAVRCQFFARPKKV